MKDSSENTETSASNDIEDELLGKRHNYRDSQTSCLKRTAQKIGFSSTEAGELKRIYEGVVVDKE